jgi:hypothetical protein
MSRIMLAVIIIAAAVNAAGVATAATPSNTRSLSPRQQLNACMTKAMAASRTLSYNEASKMCKAQLKPNPPALASNGNSAKS